MQRLRSGYVLLLMCLLLIPASAIGNAATVSSETTTTQRTHATSVKESAKAHARMTHLRHHRRHVATRVVRTKHIVHSRKARVRRTAVHRRHRYYERFTASSYADDVTAGDVTTGEDPVVRQAAIEALGNMNGTAVAINPENGRILAMVNQKLALSSGAEPCSTIKLSVALAALEEGIITKDTQVNLGGHYHLNLTEALAHSNNLYFETLGRALGFQRVKHYANEFGLGELAGYHIPGEHLGEYPDTVLPEKMGGVGRMCSFGESVSMTPLQLGALVSAIANGGTLYYLQHPTTPEEIADFKPRIKRTLNIAPLIPEIQVGMHAVVQYGTARSLRTNFNEFPVMGKTGTCSNDGTRFGWFASYADTPSGPIVTVFFLEGGRPTFGPKAAELTGVFYRQLWDNSYFAAKTPTHSEGEGTAVGLTQ
ncbi:MAG: penicillin-binding transpeptidase domain-containing protein [Acidobacteriaceae bacterium]